MFILQHCANIGDKFLLYEIVLTILKQKPHYSHSMHSVQQLQSSASHSIILYFLQCLSQLRSAHHIIRRYYMATTATAISTATSQPAPLRSTSAPLEDGAGAGAGMGRVDGVV